MLDGIQACYDHNFIRDGNALAPLMNVFHAKKIGPEIIREAIMAVSDFCDPPKADGEAKYSANGLLLINKKSYLYLVGTTLEFSDGLNGKGFVFNNPNASRTCGCGESFSL